MNKFKPARAMLAPAALAIIAIAAAACGDGDGDGHSHGVSQEDFTAQLDTIKADITALQGMLEDLETDITALDGRLDALEASAAAPGTSAPSTGEAAGTGEVAGTVQQAFTEDRGEATCTPGSSEGMQITDMEAARQVAEVSRALAEADLGIYNRGGFMNNAIEEDNPWQGVPITDQNLPCVVFFQDEIIVLEMNGQALATFLAYYEKASADFDHEIAREAQPIISYGPDLAGGADDLESGTTYRVAIVDYLTGRLTRSGVLDGSASYWHWPVYERLGYFIFATYDTQ